MTALSAAARTCSLLVLGVDNVHALSPDRVAVHCRLDVGCPEVWVSPTGSTFSSTGDSIRSVSSPRLVPLRAPARAFDLRTDPVDETLPTLSVDTTRRQRLFTNGSDQIGACLASEARLTPVPVMGNV